MNGTALITLSYTDMCMLGLFWLLALRTYIHIRARWTLRQLPPDAAWSRMCEAYITLHYNKPGWFSKANIAGLIWILIWAVIGAAVWVSQ